uniref:Uncharacterized protein n=1 Tax=Glossina austeni TaxID=7395 RepID=A0A1A9VQ02_GLOAU
MLLAAIPNLIDISLQQQQQQQQQQVLLIFFTILLCGYSFGVQELAQFDLKFFFIIIEKVGTLPFLVEYEDSLNLVSNTKYMHLTLSLITDYSINLRVNFAMIVQIIVVIKKVLVCLTELKKIRKILTSAFIKNSNENVSGHND